MSEVDLSNLVQKVMANPKYANITENLVFRISKEALDKGFSEKAALKYVRNKIHQVGGAYLKEKIDYVKLLTQLQTIPNDISAELVRNFCCSTMKLHASTAERLPILNTFFSTCLSSISPITSIMDLACGFNPLAAAWMPLSDKVNYFACDIYLNSLSFIKSFLHHVGITASTTSCDLIEETPTQKSQLALLLKSIPCLEQMEKSVTLRLLEKLNADHILVSFPVHSLSGRKIGMVNHYRSHFYGIINDKPWQVQEFQFSTELAFLVSK